jgi:hypothetical protein
VIVPLGTWLKDTKEETFCLLIADGVSLSIAFQRAGFKAKDKTVSALTLFKSPRIQQRVQAIHAARRAHPPITLPEVTDMMKRVYAEAMYTSELTPAHNAAFSPGKTARFSSRPRTT